MTAFTNAMYDKWSLFYVDLFCGSGIDAIEDVGLDWGSPLIAAQMSKQFRRLLLNDKDAKKISALKKRLQSHPQPYEPLILCEDADTAIDNFIESIPTAKSLTLALIDPYRLKDLSFNSIRKLSSRRTDLIIYFPDAIDMIRNWKAYYMGQEQSNLDRYLGTKIWRDSLVETNRNKHIEILRSIYEDQLASLGYEFTSPLRVNSKEGRPLYRLIFASRRAVARGIWERTVLRNRSGQSSFDWSRD